MNGPLFAAILVISVVVFLGWMIFLMSREPSRLVSYGSFFLWFLPLYYSGAWAAGSDIGTATLILLLMAFVWAIHSVKWAIEDWSQGQIKPDGLEEEIINSIDLTDNEKRSH
jgi:hypothetical protein